MRDLTNHRSLALIESKEKLGLIQNPEPVQPPKKTRQLIAPVQKPFTEHNPDKRCPGRGDRDSIANNTRQLIAPDQKPFTEHNRDKECPGRGDRDSMAKNTRQLIAPVDAPAKERNRDWWYSDRGDHDYTAKKSRQLIAQVHRPTIENNRDRMCSHKHDRDGDRDYMAKRPSDIGWTNIQEQMNGLKAKLEKKP